MKRFIFAMITIYILCILTIINIPKQTLTTTLGTTGNTNIEPTTTKVVRTTKNIIKVDKSVIKEYLHNEVIKTGWSEEDYQAIVRIIQRESGFKVSATNGSCYGLFQSCPGSKMKKYGKDYKTNFKTQIAFGIDYIKNRYKTPVNALKHQNMKGWY